MLRRRTAITPFYRRVFFVFLSLPVVLLWIAFFLLDRSNPAVLAIFFLIMGGVLGVTFAFLLHCLSKKEGLSLLERNFLLDFLIDNTPDRLYVKDLAGRFLWGNKALLEYFGVKDLKDVVGKTDADFFAPPHSRKTFCDERRIVETGKGLYNIEEQEFWPDGKTTWVSTTKIPLKDWQGRIIGVAGISRDITSLKQREAELKEKERFLESIFEGVQDGLSVLDRDLRILRTNAFMKKLLAFERPLEGEKCFRVYQGRNSPCDDCPALQTFRDGKPHRVLRSHGVEGQKRWVEVITYPWWNAQGEMVGVIEYVREVTERVDLETSLRESEQQFKNLAEVVPVGVLIYQQGRYVYANSQATLITGYAKEELLGMRADYPVHPQFKKEVLERIKERERGRGEREWYEIKIIRKDGVERWVLVSSLTFEYQKRPAGLVSLVDITEIKEREEHLLRLNTLLRLLQEINQRFARGGERKEIFAFVSTLFGEISPYEGGWIFLVDEKEPFFFSWGCIDEESVKRSLFSEELRKKFSQLYSIETLVGAAGRDCLGFPIIFEEKVYGLLVIVPGEAKLSQEEKVLLREIAADLGFAVRNFELLEEERVIRKVLEESERRFRNLAEALPFSVLVILRGKVVYFNSQLIKLMGREREELEGMPVEGLFGRDFVEKLKRIEPNSGSPNFEFAFYAPRGGIRWFLVRVNPFPFLGEEALLCSLLDITERKRSEEKIRFLSFHDPLTGLYNRAFFEQEVRRVDVSENLPLSVIMGDLNGLKLTNDAFGHEQGDKLLILSARLIKEVCPKESVVARFGGDEFVVLLPRCNREQARTILENIRKRFEEESRKNELPLSISLGFATKSTPSQSVEECLRIAENWMYQRKLTESSSFRSRALQILEATLRETTLETEEHSQRLARWALVLGERFGLSEHELDILSLLARFHDIGKIAIPRHILQKAGPLTPAEWAVVTKHPETGFRITQAIPELAPIATLILAHHEWWNGEGYPRGLRGEEIPLLVRIVAVCDAFDVMINGRPYKKPLSVEEALLELKRCAGTQFDPKVVELFVELAKKDPAFIQEILEQ